MSVYAGLAASASKLLAKMGGPATLRQTAAGSYDPVTQVTSAATLTETALTVALLPVGDSRAFAPGDLVRRNIQEAWVATRNITIIPQPGDHLVIGGAEWNVIRVTEYAPDQADPIAWRLYVER